MEQTMIPSTEKVKNKIEKILNIDFIHWKSINFLHINSDV